MSSGLSLNDSLDQGIFARYSSTFFKKWRCSWEHAILISCNRISSLAYLEGFEKIGFGKKTMQNSSNFVFNI